MLNTLLQEYVKKSDTSRPNSRTQNPDFPPNIAPQALADAASATIPGPAASPREPLEPPLGDEVWGTNDFDIDMTGFEELMETLPLQNGFDNSAFLDSLWNGYSYTV